MNIFDKYTKRVGTTLNSESKAQIDKNIRLMEEKFNTSPSFYVVDIDGEQVDTIINKLPTHDMKRIHFRNEYEPQVGSVISFKDKKYLLLEKDSDEIYSFGKMQECNSTISIISEDEEKVYIGDDVRGAPVYEYETKTIEEPCVVTDKYASVNDNAQIPLPEGKLVIQLKYQRSPSLEVNSVIGMYDRAYKIADLSFTDVQDGVGVMRVHADRREIGDE